MAKVVLEKITKKYNDVTIVSDINLEIPDGEFWVLVGPSGCGKSTILRSIAGLESISEGKIYLDHILVNNLPARQRDVAMVFQNYALYPHLTVAQNLGFGLKMRRLDQKIIAQKVESIAQVLNIGHLLKRKPKQLSGGQQQRVALGRAIIREPKVFLLDEPLSNLDAKLREETRSELKELHAQVGITTIYVTHDQVEAMTLADKIVVLNEGRIQQLGTPNEIYKHPTNRMVATFLGSPPMNILPVTYFNRKLMINSPAKSSQFIPLNEILTNQLNPQEGQGFDLGIRPELVKVIEPNNQGKNYHNFAYLDVIIDIIEPLGKEILVRGIIINSEILVNFFQPGNWRGKPGDRLRLGFKLEQLFFFDASRGELLVKSKPYRD
jgi:multiple sugar transport system ATP-binding protein